MSADGHGVATNQQGTGLNGEDEAEQVTATAVDTGTDVALGPTEAAASISVEPAVGEPSPPAVSEPSPPTVSEPPPPPSADEATLTEPMSHPLAAVEPSFSGEELGARPRHAATGPSRRPVRRGRRVRQRFWSIDAWSVFKVSTLFLLCVTLIVLVAGILLWNVGRRTGTIDQAESFVTRLGAYGSCVDEATVDPGTPFERDEDCGTGRVLVDGFKLDDRALLKAFMIGGGIIVVAGALASVLVALLINLLNEITGGVRFTVITEPSPRPKGRSTAMRLRR